MTVSIHVNNIDSLKEVQLSCLELPLDGSHEVIIKRLPKTRTAIQNRALHKYLTMLADKLNDAGWSFWTALLRRPKQAYESKKKEILSKCHQLHLHDQRFIDGMEFIIDAMPKADVEWTCATVKEHLWRPVQMSVVGKESTAEAERKEYSTIYDNLNRFTSEAFKIGLAWPEKESK